MVESSKQVWKTALTEIAPGSIKIRGRDIEELMTAASFAEAVYLLLKGTYPPENHRRVMNAVLISSIDHGLTPPSVLACRAVVSGGNPMNAAVAGGILAIGDSHGGAIEACARLLQEEVGEGKEAETAARLVSSFKEAGKRIPGFGHRLHREDPRSKALVEIAREEGMEGPYLRLALALEQELERSSGRRLPLNVDGAIAAVISEMGFDWRLGKGFFIISRAAGLVAHAYEEKAREKPMRKLADFEAVYDGPDRA